MLRAVSSGRPIPIATGAGGTFNGESSVWCPEQIDFRNWGVEFDNGFGRAAVKLDVPNRNGKLGWVAFMRGRNEYLPAALCESYPGVQDFWLQQVDAESLGPVWMASISASRITARIPTIPSLMVGTM